MSLNQKYTWAQFLKEHPEYKGKKLKRISNEGKKAFETAFKKATKEYLMTRLEKIEGFKKRATARHSELTKKQQAFTKAKNWPRAHRIQLEIGRQDALLDRLSKQSERTKSLQKHF